MFHFHNLWSHSFHLHFQPAAECNRLFSEPFWERNYEKEQASIHVDEKGKHQRDKSHKKLQNNRKYHPLKTNGSKQYIKGTWRYGIVKSESSNM